MQVTPKVQRDGTAMQSGAIYSKTTSRCSKARD
jgi:hypothetical protein